MSEQINKDLLAVCKELVRQAVTNGGEVTVEAVENARAAIAYAESQRKVEPAATIERTCTVYGKRYRLEIGGSCGARDGHPKCACLMLYNGDMLCARFDILGDCTGGNWQEM